MNLNDQLKELMPTFYGCNGGNLNSKIWICGTKWRTKEIKNQYKSIDDYLEQEIPKAYAKIDNYRDIATLPQFHWERESEFKNLSNYIIKCIGLYYAIDTSDFNLKNLKYNDKFKNYVKIGKSLTYSGKGFHMNRSPVARKNVNQKITCCNPEEYINYRVKFFQNLISKYNPKVIVATSYMRADDLAKFFGTEFKNLSNEGSEGLCYYGYLPTKNNTRTALLITKHFERVSYEYISNIAVFIKYKYKITQSL